MGTSKRISLIALGLFAVCFVLIYIPKIEVYGWNQVLHPQKISPAFYKRDVFAQEDRARQTLATIIGGFVILLGAFLTWLNVKIAQDKQITDRFTAAVTNLSAEGEGKMAQRLGGIYALERIARDSPKDHWTVMEVLTAYIRDKRPISNNTAQSAEKTPEELSKILPTDIQAILTVISRRQVENDAHQRLDLHAVDLSGANLRRANLENADLNGTDLSEANLIEAKLWRALLLGANLSKADLHFAELSGVNLYETNLQDAQLDHAQLDFSRGLARHKKGVSSSYQKSEVITGEDVQQSTSEPSAGP